MIKEVEFGKCFDSSDQMTKDVIESLKKKEVWKCRDAIEYATENVDRKSHPHEHEFEEFASFREKQTLFSEDSIKEEISAVRDLLKSKDNRVLEKEPVISKITQLIAVLEVQRDIPSIVNFIVPTGTTSFLSKDHNNIKFVNLDEMPTELKTVIYAYLSLLSGDLQVDDPNIKDVDRRTRLKHFQDTAQTLSDKLKELLQ